MISSLFDVSPASEQPKAGKTPLTNASLGDQDAIQFLDILQDSAKPPTPKDATNEDEKPARKLPRSDLNFSVETFLGDDLAREEIAETDVVVETQQASTIKPQSPGVIDQKNLEGGQIRTDEINARQVYANVGEAKNVPMDRPQSNPTSVDQKPDDRRSVGPNLLNSQPATPGREYDNGAAMPDSVQRPANLDAADEGPRSNETKVTDPRSDQPKHDEPEPNASAAVHEHRSMTVDEPTPPAASSQHATPLLQLEANGTNQTTAPVSLAMPALTEIRTVDADIPAPDARLSMQSPDFKPPSAVAVEAPTVPNESRLPRNTIGTASVALVAESEAKADAVRDSAPIELEIGASSGTSERGSEIRAQSHPQSQPAPLVTGSSLAREVTQAALSAKNGNSIELFLDPVELGKLEIEFTVVDDRMNIMVRADREDALDLMRRNSDELLRLLRESHVDLDTLSFSQERSGGQDNPRDFRNVAVEGAPETASDQLTSPSIKPDSARLDMRV